MPDLRTAAGLGYRSPGFSSSADPPDEPASEASNRSTRRAYLSGPDSGLTLRSRPFSAVAAGFTVGAGGIGFTVATPLAAKVNLRAGASFFSYKPNTVQDGIPINGKLQFRSVSAGVELYPYRNSFHITPGVTLYNGNHAAATADIAGGSTFTVNSVDYVSDAADPVHGTFDVSFGHRLAPSLTFGFGNMLRHDGGHWSMPVEFGFQYIGQPQFTLQMTGSVCQGAEGCSSIQSDAATQANLKAEQDKINREIAPLRFYPIATVGLSYRFGRTVDTRTWR